jgi:hypothetical protein
MRKRPFAMLALPFMVLASAPAKATSINLVPGVMDAPGAAIYQDFEGFSIGTHAELDWPQVVLSGNPQVVDTVSGDNVLGSGPPGNHYVAIYEGNTLTFTFSAPATYFGLLWGTVDGFNSITFLDGGEELATFTGFDLQDEPDHVSAIYANFFADGGAFTSVVLHSSEDAFEFDNVRVAATPLPATLGLFGIAIAGMGALGMRRRRA